MPVLACHKSVRQAISTSEYSNREVAEGIEIGLLGDVANFGLVRNPANTPRRMQFAVKVNW